MLGIIPTQTPTYVERRSTGEDPGVTIRPSVVDPYASYSQHWRIKRPKSPFTQCVNWLQCPSKMSTSAGTDPGVEPTKEPEDPTISG